MYDFNKRTTFSTVGELKDLLKDADDDAKVLICGDDYAYFHVEQDQSTVNLDNEDLDETYFSDDSGEAL